MFCDSAGEYCDLPIRASPKEMGSAGPGSTGAARPQWLLGHNGVVAIVVSVLIIVALVVILMIVYYRRRLHRLKKELHQVVQYYPASTGQW